MKRLFVALLACLMIMAVFTGCGAKVYPMGGAMPVQEFKFTDEEHKCDYCGKNPVAAFREKGSKKDDENTAYVCETCASKCMLCGKKATYYYKNGLGSVVFVCDKCYKDAKKGGILK
ncbi:MAG: hypothetical protein IJR60_05285 [Eubacterium sp.]|nr:hypothetical protein [Eubacterium sp.]